MEGKKFTIYSISTKNEVFYIGRTCNLRRRKTEHLRESHKTYNTYKVNKIRKLQNLGEPIEFNVLHENLSYEDSIRLEIEEIKLHKEKGCILTNLTDGGEGLYGVTRVFNDEWKDNLKQAKKKQFDNGYVVYNKGKKLEEVVGGKDEAEQIKIKINKTWRENHTKGLHKIPVHRDCFEPVNKGKKIEEIVGVERAKELRKLSSDTAKKTFTGTKQTAEQIIKRSKSQSKTKANWSEKQRNAIREINRINGAKAKKQYNFLINGEHKFEGTWKSLSQDIFETLGIKVHPVSLSNFYRGKTRELKCGIFSIETIDS